jgi:protein tyrosine/serine phosphatase
VLVHCQVGKDRTGLVTALVLAAVGVPASEIAADYDLSRIRLARFYELSAEDGELAATAQHAQLAIRSGSRAAAMAELLERLDVAAYLQDAGVSDDDLAALRARLVSRRPAAAYPASS